GAKGLEAPVVILPDTLSKGGGGGARPVLLPAGRGANQPPLMLWAAGKGDDDPVTRAARAEAEIRDAAERKRLLYVALTRAEDWLILCAAGQESTKPLTWYEMLERGMEGLGGVAEISGPEGLAGPVRRHEVNPLPVSGAPEDGPPPETATAPARPGWLSPAPREERTRRVSPSSLGEHAEEGGAGRGRELALTRGSAVHLLLERLAGRPAEQRRALAGRLLGRAFPELAGAVAGGVVAEALAVFDAPFAGEIFGPDSLAEAGMALDLPGVAAEPMLGRIDRLVIGARRVLVVDFKTDAQPPAVARDTPESYLAQLGCYRTALAALYPDRAVEAAILWTNGPALMPLDGKTLDRALAKHAARAS
ncbi:MAG: PD-(D/E)XK nuclease family protein, partial [Alphaproteobacteria bacterium]